jgi:hypothetical protein
MRKGRFSEEQIINVLKDTVTVLTRSGSRETRWQIL